MQHCHGLPELWVLSDERNDAVLETVLSSYTRPVAFVYRHYFLEPTERRERFDKLVRIARRHGHLVILSSDAPTAQRWGADGYYAPPRKLRPRRTGLLAIATAHDMSELAAANRFGADATMLSPVFPTRSHPDAKTLGGLRFLLMTRYAQMPVIALGGMDQRYARRLQWTRWAAVDGLSTAYPRPEQ